MSEQGLFARQDGSTGGERGEGSEHGLNGAQRRAVEHDAGPLIVLAGPGTGKTRVITHRIAHMVRARGIDPAAIVAVTFTTKAAEQLRERLSELLGEKLARRVNAHTIHGFGLRILKRFADHLDLPPVRGDDGSERAAGGRVRRCDLIDSAQRRRMLKRLILEEDLFPHARAGGCDSITDEALRLFDCLDNHGLGPAEARAFAERWAGALDQGRDACGRTLDEAGRAASAAEQARFAEFVRLHAGFDRERRASGLLTFGDLLMLPIRLLRERPDAAAMCRSEFRHWLVDEFQDVNAAQIEMLRLLAPPASGRADVCVVGDDDQAIYGFRGADDQAFRRFATIWPGATVVPLEENYRSRPPIVALANTVIQRADTRFAPDKKIIAASVGERAAGGIIQCVALADEKEDGEAIASLIRVEAAAAGTGGERPAGFYRRMAVVARTHGDLDRIEEALWLEGVPTVRWKRGSAADDDGVRDVMEWLRLLSSPRDPWPAQRLLTRSPLAIDRDLVNAWVQAYRAERSRWRAERGHGTGATGEGDELGGGPGLFPAWLRRAAGAGGHGAPADASAASAVRKFCDWFELFGAAAARESAAALIVRIVRETGVVHADLPDDRQRARRVEAVVSLLNFAQSRQGRLPPPGGVREFLEYYDDLSGAERGFESSTDPRTADEADEPEGLEGVDAVRLITAHSAKGLEFDTVFVPRVNPGHGYPKSRSNDQYEPPPGLDGRESGEHEVADARLAEERRLFYVACTRAERRLVLLARRNKTRSKSAATNYFEEILGDEALRPAITQVSVADVLEQAARAAGGGGGAASSADALRGLRGTDEGVRDRRRELFERARRDVRLAAAAALGRADAPGVSERELESARAVLAESADRLAAIAQVEATGEAPAWVDRLGPGPQAQVRALAAACAPASGGAASGRRHGWMTRVPQPPLALSYTAICDYQRCPRCYYAKYVLGLEGREEKPAVLGIALHAAFERFYGLFRDADASGRRPPSLHELLAMAREEFFDRLPGDHEVDPHELDKFLAQVRLGFERLHRPDIHVLETELALDFDYHSAAAAPGQPGGSVHRMRAKIDRLDQVTLPDGRAGFRIVDYKTGAPRKALLEPDTRDLQMGIYAMALREEYGVDIAGVAEYWVFATGERGSIDLAEIDDAGVRKQIDKAVAGILGGSFEQGRDCEHGVCEVLGPDGAA